MEKLMVEYDGLNNDFLIEFLGISVVFDGIKIEMECKTIELLRNDVCVVTFHSCSAFHSPSFFEALYRAKNSESIVEVEI